MMNKKKVRKIGNSTLSESELSRKYMGAGLASNIEIVPEDALWIPSTNLYLNYTLGGGAHYGKIMEVFGGESSGKTLLAMDFSSVVHSLNGIVLWNDAEQAFDKVWAAANRMDLSKTYLYNETSIELVSDWVGDMTVTMRKKLTHNEPILFVCDSMAALDCEDNINASQLDSKAEMGNRAKALYKWLRIRNQFFSEMGITLIFINQLRKKVGAGMYEDPDITPGGNAMKFFASQRLAFFQKKQITEGNKENKIWLGNYVSVRVKKNKLAPPRPSFTTEIYFNEEYNRVGFSRYVNLDNLFLKTGVVTKNGTSYYFGDEKIACGRDNFSRVIEEDNTLRRKLLKKSNINTVSKTRKQLEKLINKGENRYPIKVKASRKKDEDSDDE